MACVHKTVRVRVWADVDEGVADMVRQLNILEGVTTHASCQGTIGEGGEAPYKLYVLANWTKAIEPKLRELFSLEPEGDCWGYIRPRH